MADFDAEIFCAANVNGQCGVNQRRTAKIFHERFAEQLFLRGNVFFSRVEVLRLQHRMNQPITVPQIVTHHRNFFATFLHQSIVFAQRSELIFHKPQSLIRQPPLIKLLRRYQHVPIEKEEYERQIETRKSFCPRMNQRLLRPENHDAENHHERQEGNVFSVVVEKFFGRQKFYKATSFNRQAYREQQQINDGMCEEKIRCLKTDKHADYRRPVVLHETPNFHHAENKNVL